MTRRADRFLSLDDLLSFLEAEDFVSGSFERVLSPIDFLGPFPFLVLGESSSSSFFLSFLDFGSGSEEKRRK
jgi:hypothetical protein